MTEQEIKTQQALIFMGYKELREISKSELDLSFKAMSYKINPETCTNEKYKDGKDYLLLLEYYNYLSDIKRTNETIRNILNPENKTYQYQDEKPEEKVEENLLGENVVADEIPNNQNQGVRPTYTEVQIIDRPSILSLILSFFIPIYGIIMFIFSRRITPKSAKWYLIVGIIGYVINFIILMVYFMNGGSSAL